MNPYLVAVVGEKFRYLGDEKTPPDERKDEEFTYKLATDQYDNKSWELVYASSPEDAAGKLASKTQVIGTYVVVTPETSDARVVVVEPSDTPSESPTAQ